MSISAVLLHPSPRPRPRREGDVVGKRWLRPLPGIALCIAVTLIAVALQAMERQLFGAAWLEGLVLAIVVGAVARTVWAPGARFQPGIDFSAKLLLEVAVVLLGLSVSAATLLRAGPALLGGIAGVVMAALAVSYGLGRLFGLSHRMAVLVACGNSICGNSAIAAVAPVIGADGKDVAASIAFTAVFGVALVILLPLAAPLLHFSGAQYGVLAGLTVYAVPQVLAATAPLGAVAVQVGTLVKLIRVLMLGPVVLGVSLLPRADGGRMPAPHRLVPWFILGFLGLAAARPLVPMPAPVPHAAAAASGLLTVIAMAALGLSTDLRMVARAGGRVTGVVVLSLLALGAISVGLIRLLGLA